MTSEPNWASQIRTLPATERRAVAEQLVREEAALVLSHPAAEKLDAERSLTALGMDSVGSVELQTLLAEATGLPLASTIVFDYPNISGLAQYLLDQADDGQAGEALHDQPAAPPEIDAFDTMSERDLIALVLNSMATAAEEKPS